MGRGRQRAKDAKIARQLKYANNGSDLRALERELVSGHPDPMPISASASPDEATDTPRKWDEDFFDEDSIEER